MKMGVAVCDLEWRMKIQQSLQDCFLAELFQDKLAKEHASYTNVINSL